MPIPGKTRPVIISQHMVSKALKDSNFFNVMPEFSGLRNQLKQAEDKVNGSKGCSGCRRRRVIRNLYRDFVNIVLALNTVRLEQFKRYIGVEQLMVNTLILGTHKAQIKIL